MGGKTSKSSQVIDIVNETIVESATKISNTCTMTTSSSQDMTIDVSNEDNVIVDDTTMSTLGNSRATLANVTHQMAINAFQEGENIGEVLSLSDESAATPLTSSIMAIAARSVPRICSQGCLASRLRPLIPH